MMPLETRKALGEVTETEHSYGPYRLKILWYRDFDGAQVTMYELGAKWPMRWSKSFTKRQARGCIILFEHIGYFDMPVG